MLARLISPVFNMSRIGFVLVMLFILLSSLLLIWISTLIQMPLFQFVFVIVVPFIFVVVIPVFSLLIFLKLTSKTYSQSYE